ncbi:hypothetical protein O1M63_26460 [Streptomyces mirabilis]|nr:hypothetical protein [Streptomyces mirabilis]
MSVPSQYGPGDELVPAWGRQLTVPCPRCTLATHRHPTMDYDGEYVSQQYQGPEAESAYRLVYAFTDHDVVQVWGTSMPRQVEL